MNSDSIDFLEAGKYISLATHKRSGDIIRTPVWFAEHNGSYYVLSSSDTGKIKRLRNFKEVYIAACDYPGKLKGRDFDTTAHLVETPEESKTAENVLQKKYGLEMRLINFLAWITRSAPRVYIRIDRPTE